MSGFVIIEEKIEFDCVYDCDERERTIGASDSSI